MIEVEAKRDLSESGMKPMWNRSEIDVRPKWEGVVGEGGGHCLGSALESFLVLSNSKYLPLSQRRVLSKVITNVNLHETLPSNIKLETLNMDTKKNIVVGSGKV